MPDETALIDIWVAARAALSHLGAMEASALEESRLRASAIMREITVIGEAARRLTSEFRSAHAEIPWADIIEMRNVLVHEYDQIELGELWRVCREDIPALLAQIRPLLPPE